MRRLLLALVLALARDPARRCAPAAVPVSQPTCAADHHRHAEYAATLTADPGQWTPAATTYAYQWLRDGQPIARRPGRPTPGPRRPRAHAGGGGHRERRLGDSGSATSAPTGPVQRATLKAKGGQKIDGVARFTHTLDAHPGRYTASPPKVATSGCVPRPGRGRHRKRYEIRPEDVGARLRVRITVLAPGYQPLDVTTDRAPQVRHRVDVRRTVRYHVETRGRITTSLKEFTRPGAADLRGRRAAGAAPASGSCRWPAAARSRWCCRRRAWCRAFSSACSAMWSCRVGRFVIINQDRWKNASPAWNAAHLRAARLPAHGRQPRDRPLARAGPRLVPRQGPAGAGDDAAVQGARRLPVQPVPDDRTS